MNGTSIQKRGHGENTEASAQKRFHAFDALRASALLLGIFFHAAESFCPGRESWAIIDNRAHVAFDVFQHVSHSFRLEIFFLMAGFFAHLMLNRRGGRRFLTNRLSRIGIPFVAGWFLLYPILVFLWLQGASMSGRMDALGVPGEVQSFPVWKITLGALCSPDFYRENFNLTHLWFLHQLLVIYLLACPLHWAALKWGFMREKTDVLIGGLVTARSRLIWLSLVTTPLLVAMDGWGVDTPNESLIPHLPTTLLYGLFFMVGGFLHRRTDLIPRFCRGWVTHLLIGTLFVVVTKTFFLVADALDPETSLAWLRKPLYSLCYAVMMWSFVLGFVGLFVRWCSSPSAAWRYVADSSYWLYLVHHPVVVSLQLGLAYRDFSAALKYLIICAITFPLLFLSYQLWVRSTWVGEVLNGKRYPRKGIAPIIASWRRRCLNEPRPKNPVESQTVSMSG